MTCSRSWTTGGGSGWPRWSPVRSRSWLPRPSQPTCQPSWRARGSRWRGVRSGMPDEPVPDRLRRAREALASAKADALAKGNRPARADDLKSERKSVGGPRPDRPGRGAHRPRRDDPERLNTAIEGLIDTHGWQEAAAGGSVFGRWA